MKNFWVTNKEPYGMFLVFSVVVNCNGYTDPEEFENKKRRKK